MEVKTVGEIRYYQFAAFEDSDLVHGVFARHGGVSAGPYASLNLSVSTGDAPENVRENRLRAFRALERTPDSIADLWLVHSNQVVVADEPRGARESLGKADALISDRPSLTLCLRFADCVPILLYDPRRYVVGIVHAGWKGTLAKIAAATMRAMTERYGSRPSDVLAGIGPSIGPCHYEVGPEVVAGTRAAFGAEADALLTRTNGHCHLDLWAANAHALREVGVECIEQSEICTACRTDEFFSHRGEKGRTGRFGALIGLR
jgi:YfiH family protein